VLPDRELPGVITQHYGIVQEAMRMDAAPLGAFSSDLHWIRCHGQHGKAEPLEVCRPSSLIGKGCLRLFGQSGDQGGGQCTAAHIVERRLVQHEVGMAGAQQIKEIQPALRWPCAEPSETIIADLRAETVRRFMPCAGVIHRYPRRCLQSRSQHIAGFAKEAIMLVCQQPLDLTLRDRQTNRLQQGG
jgi:hypothetical protein